MKYLLILSSLLVGCAKSASESAADASMHQIGVVEQQIKKECPAAKIDESINALKTTIKTQLLSCESEKATLRERNNTLLVILIAIILLWGFAKWSKIQKVL